MGPQVLKASARRWTAVFALVFTGVLSACGITSDRDRAVSTANSAIVDVDRTGSEIADAIAALSADSGQERDLMQVREAGENYLAATETLNGAIREMGDANPRLRPYVQEIFLGAAESAVSDCQRALELLRNDAISDQELRGAITRLGRCIDRYANAIEGVSNEYAKISAPEE